MTHVLLVVLLLTLPAPSKAAEKTPIFARLEYEGSGGEGGIKAWYTDYPAMDLHLSRLLSRLTNLDAPESMAHVKPSSKDLFQYPLIYSAEPEQIKFSAEDAANMCLYLRRGGFWFMDDFHGDEELSQVAMTLWQVSQACGQSWTWQPLPPSHEIFHAFFDIKHMSQVVNDSIIARCGDGGCDLWENGPSGRDPQVFSIADPKGRIMILMAFNNDLGDGLEWIDDPSYPFVMSKFAVQFCINVFMYALTH